ncbi:L-2-amino-thiazoline-4-carboxylic acid hydrolase [Thermodesulfobacteriota bacterium]
MSKEFGFEKANEMNMAINKIVGKLEVKNYMTVSKIDKEYIKRDLIQNLKLNLELCAQDVFKIIDFYNENNNFVLKISKCAAHFGTQKADYMHHYKCACFKRAEGWFDAIGMNVTVSIQKSLVNGDKFCEIIIIPDS